MFIKYKVIYSNRRSIAIVINKDGEVTVRAPKSIFVNKKTIEDFVQSKESWIIKNLDKINKNKKSEKPKIIDGLTAQELKQKREEARKVISERLNNYAKKYNFKFLKFRLSSAKTRWGSCSTSGTISINWHLIFAPIDMLDYVIVHELCHTKHHNHSKFFWNEVAKIIPDYKERRKWLRDNGNSLQ